MFLGINILICLYQILRNFPDPFLLKGTVALTFHTDKPNFDRSLLNPWVTSWIKAYLVKMNCPVLKTEENIVTIPRKLTEVTIYFIVPTEAHAENALLSLMEGRGSGVGH